MADIKDLWQKAIDSEVGIIRLGNCIRKMQKAGHLEVEEHTLQSELKRLKGKNLIIRELQLALAKSSASKL